MTPLDASSGKGLSLGDDAFLREEIRHQDNLVNARLSWLVSSQSFLLSGFAVSLNGSALSLSPVYAKLNAILATSLPVAGLVTVVASYLTIWAAIPRMAKIRHLAGSSHPSHLPSVQAEACLRRMGLAGPVLIPVVFLAVWLAIVVERWLS